MTRRKALLQVFVLLGTFVCFLLATVVMVVSGLLSTMVWAWVVVIGSVIATVVLSWLFSKNKELSFGKPDRNPN
jgi:O-antigen/teichoic acid export membrane protein